MCFASQHPQRRVQNTSQIQTTKVNRVLLVLDFADDGRKNETENRTDNASIPVPLTGTGTPSGGQPGIPGGTGTDLEIDAPTRRESADVVVDTATAQNIE